MKFSFSFERQPKTIPFVSPKAITGAMIKSSKVLPEHARIIRDLNRASVRMYEAAVSNNLNNDFPITISSANAEIFMSTMPTRSRARTLERDNPYAWAMLESMRLNVGGHDPFRLEMKVCKKGPDGEFIEEDDTNEKIEDFWRTCARPENCTTRRDMSRLELYLQAITAMVRDGGVLARHYRAFPKNKIGYALRPLEIDRLDHYYNGKNEKTGNQIKMSVEMDEFDGVEAFWLLTKHPGDILYLTNIEQKYREYVPARDIIALFDIRTRAEQTTAVSRFASVITRLHRIEQFDAAHTLAAVFAACKPLFIIQKFPTAMEYVPDYIKKAMDTQFQALGEGEGEKVSNIEPATAETLPYGQEPFLVDPKFPVEAAVGFKKDQLRAAAAGSGTAYHMIGQDLEGVNFSSGRLGENPFHDTCKILQEHFVYQYVHPHFQEALKAGILSGRCKVPMSRYEEFCEAAIFHGRRWPYINPLQDAQADILRIEAGLDSRSHVISESDRGGDTHEVNSEIASDKKCDEAHGLDFSNADVTKPTISKGEPGETVPSAEGEETPLPEKKGGKQTLKSNGNGFHRRSLLDKMTKFAAIRDNSK